MRCALRLFAISLLAAAGCRSPAPVHPRSENAASQTVIAAGQEEAADLPGIGEASAVTLTAQPIEVSDPLEPVNRAFFWFNDKLFFWVLKPASTGYAYVMPQRARRGVKNFFSNLATPVRLVNCALQAEFKGAWVEIERLAINTTVGVAGFGDPARTRWNMEKRDEDLGQTLGRYGIGPSIYFDWPIIGPSTVRDTAGYVGDMFLDPVNYLIPDFWYNAGVKASETVNGTSLRVGEYESFKNAAIDPYVALRDAYYQYRKSQAANSEERTVRPEYPMSEE